MLTFLETISICKICDVGKAPEEIPSEACGHSYVNRGTIAVTTIPAYELTRLLDEIGAVAYDHGDIIVDLIQQKRDELEK